MRVISLTERQLHAMILPALQYRAALCVWNADTARLRIICCQYGERIEVMSPWSDASERLDQIMRLLNPSLRERAMILPHWRGLSPYIMHNLQQVRLIG